MSVGATETASLGNQADDTRLFNPLLGCEDEAVEAKLFFNPLEFEGIKIGVVELLPNTEKLNGVAITEPVLNEVVSAFGMTAASHQKAVPRKAPAKATTVRKDASRTTAMRDSR